MKKKKTDKQKGKEQLIKDRIKELKEKIDQQKFNLKDSKIDLAKIPHAEETYHPYDNLSWHSLKKRKLRRIESKFPDKVVIVRIHLRNGFLRNFIAKEHRKGIVFNDQFYILDSASKKYDIDAKLWCYEFHESYSLPLTKSINGVSKIAVPIDQEINVNDIIEALNSSGLTEISYASNPSILKWFMDSRIQEKILMGVDEDAFFRFMKTLLIIITIGVVIVLLLSLWNTGVFSSFTKS